MRTEGRPSGVAVARAMISGSVGALHFASSYHERKTSSGFAGVMTANAPLSHGGHAPGFPVGFPVLLAQVQCTGLEHFIKGQVGKNHAARADILRRMNRQDEA